MNQPALTAGELSGLIRAHGAQPAKTAAELNLARLRRDREAAERWHTNRGRMALQRLPETFRGDVQGIADRVSHDALRGLWQRWSPGVGNLVLRGPSGIGKSSAMALVVRHWLRQAFAQRRERPQNWRLLLGVQWLSVPELEPRDRKPWELAPMVERAANADLLVIDDLGRESKPQHIADILLSRYDRGQPTLTTTNLRQPEIGERYGQAIERRIYESGGRAPVVVDCWGAG